MQNNAYEHKHTLHNSNCLITIQLYNVEMYNKKGTSCRRLFSKTVQAVLGVNFLVRTDHASLTYLQRTSYLMDQQRKVARKAT